MQQDRAAGDGLPGDVAHAARSGAAQTITVLAQAVLPLTHVLLARLFGRTIFGAYQSSVAMLEVLTRGGTGGGDKAMLRFVAASRAVGDEQGVERALGTGLRLAFIVGTVLAVAVAAGAPVIARWTGNAWLVTSLPSMAPAIVFTGATYVLIQATLAARSTRQNFIVRGVAEPGLLLIAGLAAWGLGRGSLGALATAHAAAAACTTLLALHVAGRLFGAGRLRRAVRAPRLPGLIRFALPMGTTELLGGVLQRADILLLSMYLDAPAAGVYAAAEFLGRSIANIRYAFDSIAASVLSEAYRLGQRERLRYNLALMTRWVATIAAPMAASVVALRRPLLSLYGPGFADGATAMVLLCVSHLVNGTLGLVPWLIMVSGRSRLMLVNNLVGACLNIALGLTLIPRFGIVGTAIAVLCTIVVLQALYIVQALVLEHTHPFELRLVKPFLAAGAMFLAQDGLTRVLHGAAGVVAVLAGGLVVFVLALWALGPAPEDVALVHRLLARLRRRTSTTAAP